MCVCGYEQHFFASAPEKNVDGNVWERKGVGNGWRTTRLAMENFPLGEQNAKKPKIRPKDVCMKYPGQEKWSMLDACLRSVLVACTRTPEMYGRKQKALEWANHRWQRIPGTWIAFELENKWSYTGNFRGGIVSGVDYTATTDARRWRWHSTEMPTI